MLKMQLIKDARGKGVRLKQGLIVKKNLKDFEKYGNDNSVEIERNCRTNHFLIYEYTFLIIKRNNLAKIETFTPLTNTKNQEKR